MKSCRYIKYRSFSRDAAELCQDLHHNPLKISTVIRPSHEVTAKILGSYKKPLNLQTAKREPLVSQLPYSMFFSDNWYFQIVLW